MYILLGSRVLIFYLLKRSQLFEHYISMFWHYIYLKTGIGNKNQTPVTWNMAGGYWEEEQQMDLAPTLVAKQQISHLVDGNINRIEPESAPRRVKSKGWEYSKKYGDISCSKAPVERYHVDKALIILHFITWFLKEVADYVGW